MNPDQPPEQIRQRAGAALEANEFPRAAALFEQYLRLIPDDAGAWFLLGACQDRCDRPADALQSFAAAESLQPGFPQAANAQAAMLSALGRWSEALAAFERALLHEPGDVQLLVNRGIALEKLGRDEEALTSYNVALASDPRHPGALNNRGVLHLKCGRAEAALEDHLRFVAIAPASPIGHYNCADAYAALSRDEEALAACDAVLKLDPHHVKALITRGMVLAGLGKFDDANAAFAAGKRLDPEQFAAVLDAVGGNSRLSYETSPGNIYCWRRLERLRDCDWRQYDEFIDRFERLVHDPASNGSDPIVNPTIAYGALALPIRQETRLALVCGIATAVQRGVSSTAYPRAGPESSGKLKIGYVSPDFREHPVAHLTRGLYALHDRSTFSVHAYSLKPEESEKRREIIAGCDVFREVGAMSTAEIVETIRRDEVDILVDLAGYTAWSRPDIFPARAAPITVSWLGFAGSQGAPWIDYFITDSVASPPDQSQFHTEKMVRLPGGCYPYHPDQKIAPAQSRQAHRLPNAGMVFCCFNNSFKITPRAFLIWMRLLQRVPESVLWLFAASPAAARNLAAEAARCGVDPVRLVFAPAVPMDEYYARFQSADLFLDTFPFCGHTTGLDALFAGLPVLTCAGDSFAARLGASHLTALGVPELIAESEFEYEERAYQLATDPAKLRVIREKMAALHTVSPLFKTEPLVRELERAYREMWRRHTAGLAPDAITL